MKNVQNIKDFKKGVERPINKSKVALTWTKAKVLLGFQPNNKERASRAAAFTLAEVLITLGIIGVVAAMSIPTLMNTINDM